MASYRACTITVTDPRYPLWNTYQRRFEEVAGRYDYSPHQVGGYAARAEVVARLYAGDRLALARALEDYNLAMGAPPESLASARTLGRPDSLVVIAGQQPGLLTGPLYTFWKAAALVDLARELQAVLPGGTPVVPVFWLGSEDHDLPEVAAVHFLTPDGRLAHHRYDPGEGFAARTSVGRLPTGEAAAAFLGEIAGSLWNTEFTGDVLDLLRSTAQTSRDLGEWFARLMLSLFGRAGLILADPMDPGLRAAQAPLLVRLIQDNEALAQAFDLGCRRTVALGYEPQVKKLPGAANLYLYRDDERVPLFRLTPERFRIGGEAGGETLTAGELTAIAEARPELLSPNVVLRPLVQETVFPLLAYLGGPGETSYFGLYRELFHRLDRTMPVIYPRPTVTLVEGPAARHISRLRLQPAEVLDLDALRTARSRHLDQTDPVGIETVFRRLTDEVEREHRRASETILEVARSLGDLAEKNRERVLEEIRWLERKVLQQHRQNSREAIRRFDYLEVAMRPGGDYQERVYNIFSYLAKYGLELAQQLQRHSLVPPGGGVNPEHRLLWLDDPDAGRA